jgi:glycolate oxidase iron-sulfur subunit
MQTNFTAEQLQDPGVAASEKILQVLCALRFLHGHLPDLCHARQRTRQSARRIYLIKDMLENGRPADEQVVTHIDRCLSCLACMTTCPSGVNYMHLVDHARAHIEKTYKRPLMNRHHPQLLAMVLPYPGRFRASLSCRPLGRPFARLFRAIPASSRSAPCSNSLRSFEKPSSDSPNRAPMRRRRQKRGRVAILTGCAQPVLKPGINEATIRL